MKLTINNMFISIMIAFSLLLSVSYAVADFSVSPNSFNLEVNNATEKTEIITIENTGNETLNLTIIAEALTGTGDDIELTLNTQTIENLENTSSTNIQFTFTTPDEAGTYEGEILIYATNNPSLNATIPISLEVVEFNPPIAKLEIEDFGDTIEVDAEIDEREIVRLKIENTGEIDLTDIEFFITDLDGEDSSDEIENNDIEFEDEGFDLDVGESEVIDMEIDVPNNIERDLYVGTLRINTDEGFTFEWDVEVNVEGGDVDITIQKNRLFVRDGIMEMVGEEGERVDDITFEVSNDGNVNVNDIKFEVDSDLEEEFSSNTIPASAVSFSPSTIDLDSDDEEDIEVKVDIPDGQASGTYFTTINVVSEDGDDEYDSITLKVKVVGDVYIKEIIYDEEVGPGDILEVEVVVKNQGSRLYTDVQIEGTIFDIDSFNSDLIESTSSFLLDVREEESKTLRFRIPEDASDNGHTLEIRVDYGDEQIIEIDQITVVRPLHSIEIESYAINPSVIKCTDNLFTYMKVKNLGRFEEDIKISAEILNEPIIQESSTVELDVDENIQKNFVLDISTLEPGTYTVVQKVVYSGSLFEKRESTLRIDECNEGSGIDVKPINKTPINQTQNDTQTDTGNTINIFGGDYTTTSVILGTGLVIVIVLIIFSLFLI